MKRVEPAGKPACQAETTAARAAFDPLFLLRKRTCSRPSPSADAAATAPESLPHAQDQAAAPTTGATPQHVLHPERYTRYSLGVSLVVGGGVAQLPAHFDRPGEPGSAEGEGGEAVSEDGWRGARGNWAWQAADAEGGEPPATPSRDEEGRGREENETSVSQQSQESARGEAGDPSLSAESARRETRDVGAVRFVASKRRFWSALTGPNSGSRLEPSAAFVSSADPQPPSRGSSVAASLLSREDAAEEEAGSDETNMEGVSATAEGNASGPPSPALLGGPSAPIVAATASDGARVWRERSGAARGRRGRRAAVTVGEQDEGDDGRKKRGAGSEPGRNAREDASLLEDATEPGLWEEAMDEG